MFIQDQSLSKTNVSPKTLKFSKDIESSFKTNDSKGYEVTQEPMKFI